MTVQSPVRSIARRPRAAAAQGTGHGRGRAGEILDIALELFAEQGYTSVTIKDIAGRGRINPALIYYYYHNKEDLFVAALKHAVHEAMARHDRFARGEATPDSPPEVIRRWFEANAILAKPLSQILMLMLHYRASRQRSTSIQRLIKKFYDAEMDLLADAIGLGIRLGLFRPVDTREAALFVSTHLDGLIVAASVRTDIDLKLSLSQFQSILFAYLGYAQPLTAAPGLPPVA